jgi:hypothetical protein
MPAAKLTPEISARICRALSFGIDIVTACAIEGISRRSYYVWRKRGELGEEPYAEFLAATDQARAKVEVAVMARLAQHALHGSDWRAAAEWIRIVKGGGARTYEIQVRADSGGDPLTIFSTQHAEQVRRTLFELMSGRSEVAVRKAS